MRAQIQPCEPDNHHIFLIWQIQRGAAAGSDANDDLPRQRWFQFPEGKDVLTLSAHYLSFVWLCRIWLHGDPLYPSINRLPPAVIRSVKVTSVWLQLLTGPVRFIAELYIWTTLVSLKAPPPISSSCMLYSQLIPPPQHVSQQQKQQESQALISSLSISISPHWPVDESHGCRFHFIQIKHCTKDHTNQIAIRAATLGMQQEKLCTHFQLLDLFKKWCHVINE